MRKSTKILAVAGTLLVFFAVFLLLFSSAVFLQLFIAFALAYLLEPAVSYLERRSINRILGIFVVFALAVVLTTGLILFFVTSISGELANMQLNLPNYAQRLYQIVPDQLKSYLGMDTPELLSQRLGELFRQLGGSAPELLKPLLAFLKQAFSSTIGFVLALLGYLIIPVYLFYLLADWPRIKAAVEALVPERHRPLYHAKLQELDSVLSGFVRGQLSLCGILAVLYSIGLYVIGIDLAIAIGTLAGLAFIIPYVGTIIGIILSVLMALLKFHDLLHPLLCLGWFGLVQLLEGTILTPRIVGNRVGLHPVVAIVALLIGGQLFGLMGMLLAIPVTAVLQIGLHSLLEYYRASEVYQGTE